MYRSERRQQWQFRWRRWFLKTECWLILLDGVDILDGFEGLVDRDRLAGEDGLVYAEGGRVDGDDATVGGDLVAHGENEHIAGDEVFGADLFGGALTNDVGGVGAVLLERVDGLVSVTLLNDTDGSIGNEDEEDDAGFDESSTERGVLLEKGKDKRDDGGSEKDEHELVLELVEDELP